jgi:hypothetical protein
LKILKISFFLHSHQLSQWNIKIPLTFLEILYLKDAQILKASLLISIDILFNGKVSLKENGTLIVEDHAFDGVNIHSLDISFFVSISLSTVNGMIGLQNISYSIPISRPLSFSFFYLLPYISSFNLNNVEILTNDEYNLSLTKFSSFYEANFNLYPFSKIILPSGFHII